MSTKFKCQKCNYEFRSTNADVGTIEGEIATCPNCGGISEPHYNTEAWLPKLYQWIVVFTHNDYHCIYMDSHQITAPNKDDVVKLAKIAHLAKHKYGDMDSIEEIFGPFNLTTEDKEN